jgi:hypothetical protein
VSEHPADFRGALSEAFLEMGLSEVAAERFGAFVDELVRVRIEARLAAFLTPLRGCVFGEALWRELAGDPAESNADAARRLHTSERELRRTRERIRALLANPVLPPDRVEP